MKRTSLPGCCASKPMVEDGTQNERETRRVLSTAGKGALDALSRCRLQAGATIFSIYFLLLVLPCMQFYAEKTTASTATTKV